MNRLYQDIHVWEEENSLAFGNSKLVLRFNRAQGSWQSLTLTTVEGSLISPKSAEPDVDFRINGRWMVQQHGSKLLGYTCSVDPYRKSASLRFKFGVLERGQSYEYELETTYMLFPNQSRIHRFARLTRTSGAQQPSETHKMEGFLFRIPSVLVGDPEECTIDVPGPWFPSTYVAPNTPYKSIA
ncbi:MAG: hypothetical protein ACP5R4_06510, partial [Armatimonadota bacterium]